MRDSLKRSLADSPVRDFERYPKDSVVLCNACSLPILFLDRAICLGDKGGQSASAFKPLSVQQLIDLRAREDIDAGVRAALRAKSLTQLAVHAAKLHEFKTGDPMICPACECCFVQVLAVEAHEALDKSYTMELLTIPPVGHKQPPVRGKQIGVGKGWVH